MLNDSSALDRAFQALSDPTRRGILARLGGGPKTVGEIAQPLPMSLPAVLQHLKALEASGLVVSEKKGRVRTCRLDGAMLAAAESWLSVQRRHWEAHTDRLEAYAKRLKEAENDGDARNDANG